MIKLGGNEKHVKYAKTCTFSEMKEEISKSWGEYKVSLNSGGM